MFHKLSFHKRSFLYYSLLMSIVIIILIVVFSIYISDILKQRSLYTMEQMADKITTQLDNVITNMDVISTQVMSDRNIQESMVKALEYTGKNSNYFDKYSDLAIQIRSQLVSINSPKVIVRRICLFNGEQNFISAGTVHQDTQAVIQSMQTLSWTDEVYSKKGSRVIIPPHNDDWLENSSSSMVISLARALRSSYITRNIIGIVEVQQPYSMISNICKAGSIKNLRIIVMDDRGRAVYPADDVDTAELNYYFSHISSTKDNSSSILKNPHSNIREMIYFNQSQYTGWTTILAQPVVDLLSPVFLIQKILYIFGLIVILFTLLLILVITRRLTAPIRELTASVKNISLQNLSVNLSNYTGNNEVMHLNQAFNEMLKRLDESMNQMVQAKSSELHSHFLALQAQINPHFLYNTLMGISAVGQEAGIKKISQMCSNLSNMLRYTASFNNSDILLRDEVMHAENYLKLCKFRYEDDLSYSFIIDENIYNISAPKLILQPIIENCFLHGFSNTRPPWEITIKGYIESDYWYVEISDNGSGFDNNAIIQINQRVDKYRKKIDNDMFFNELEVGGLGLINIYLRLKLFYGDSTVFMIENKENRGCKVKIGGMTKYLTERRI